MPSDFERDFEEYVGARWTRLRRSRATLSVGAVIAAVGATATVAAVADAPVQSNPPQATIQPASATSSNAEASVSPPSLICETDLMVDGTFDNWLEDSSTESPVELAQLFIDPSTDDREVLATESNRSATVFIVRSDGTAHTELGYVLDPKLGWRLETFYACADHGLDKVSKYRS